MTNQSLRSLAISLTALGLLAGPAWSARVVEVRVGNHPTFTRVVFELDAKAGYEIERREVEGGSELVVTLSASSRPRTIDSRSVMVTGVEIEPSGTEAIARVRLRRAAPLVKELILTSPPRIVLDLMLPEDLASAAAAPKAKPKPAPATPSQTEPQAPPEVAAAPKATEPPKAEPPKTALPKTAAPKAESLPKTAAPKAESPKPPAPVETAKPAPAVPKPPATAPAPTPSGRVETALEGDRVVAPKGEGAGEVETADAAPSMPAPPVPKPPPAEVPKAAPKPAPAPPASKPASGPFGLDLGADSMLQYGLVGGGALLFLLVVGLILRKHSRSTSLDALESAREPMGAGDSFDSESASGVGAGMGMDTQRETFPTAGPGLFDDDSEKGDMDMAAQIPMDREPRRMTQGAAGDSDASPLLRELERRMTQLESRLDQANEARERLERQVTAQSEELRVQRAAIARTQRALRGMTRGGEEATEPALRDPSKPPTTRP